MKITNSGFCTSYFNDCMERLIKADFVLPELFYILSYHFANSHADFDGNATACISKYPV